jgi:hypothetical protein
MPRCWSWPGTDLERSKFALSLSHRLLGEPGGESYAGGGIPAADGNLQRFPAFSGLGHR